MKWSIFSFLVLVSCSPPPVTIFQRHATIVVPSKLSSGSAVSLGRGYFFTAKHVISDSFVVHNKKGRDNRPLLLFGSGEIIMFKADIDTKLPGVEIVEPKIGEVVYALQPALLDDSLNVLLLKGNVAYITPYYGIIDRPVFPGISGSGVFNEKGELVGILSQSYDARGQVAFGIFIKAIVFKTMFQKSK